MFKFLIFPNIYEHLYTSLNFPHIIFLFLPLNKPRYISDRSEAETDPSPFPVVANSLLYQYVSKIYSVVEIYAEAVLAIRYFEGDNQQS